MAEAKTTTDHNEIRKWVEDREGRPSRVQGTGDLLRIDFPSNVGDDELEKISWDDFFNAFDENELTFLYQDEKDSRFNKFIRDESKAASS
jgi:hypothetical protein